MSTIICGICDYCNTTRRPLQECDGGYACIRCLKMSSQERANIKHFDKWFPRLCIIAALLYATTGWIQITAAICSWIFK